VKKLLPQIALLLFGFITSNVCAQASPVPINLNNLGPKVMITHLYRLYITFSANGFSAGSQ